MRTRPKVEDEMVEQNSGRAWIWYASAAVVGSALFAFAFSTLYAATH